MKKLLYIILIFSTFHLFSESITWDITDQDNKNIFKSTNIIKEYAKTAPVFYKIKEKKITTDQNTDLYLSFDKNNITDITTNYKILYSNYKSKETNAHINESALFFRDDYRIELAGNINSLFTPGKNINSFTMSFWFFPFSISTKETILKIGSQYFNEEKNKVEEQSIIVALKNGKVEVAFNNLVYLLSEKVQNIKMDSYGRLKVKDWNLITVKYNLNEKKVYMELNGKTSAILLTTKDGTPFSEPINFRFDKNNRAIINIAPDFTGAIDDFLISHNIKETHMEKYNKKGGIIQSNVFKIGDFGGTIKDIAIEDKTGENSDILYFYREANYPFFAEHTVNTEVKWQKLTKDSLTGKNIKYFQWKALFLPGEKNIFSPRLKSIKLFYEKNIPPSSPKGLKVIIDNNKAHLKWLKNSEIDIKGYKIYYGKNSGEYFGKGALEGDSPIDIGLNNKFTINNLDGNEIHYFRVTAYSDNKGEFESDFSEEVQARPLDIE